MPPARMAKKISTRLKGWLPEGSRLLEDSRLLGGSRGIVSVVPSRKKNFEIEINAFFK